MKSLSLILTATVLSLLFSGCGLCTRSQKNNMEQKSGLYDVTWKLIELQGASVAEKVNDKSPFITFDENTKQYSAYGGCNGLGGTFETKAGKQIKFSQGVSTMMACPDMSVENGFKVIFGKTVNYEIQNDNLILKEGKTILARFAKLNETENLSLNGNWELNFLSIPNEDSDQLFRLSKPTISFDTKESKVSGNTGCNNYFGGYTQQKNKINFNQMGVTKKACPDTMKGEQVFLQTLGKINGFSVYENTLTLLIGDIATMSFKKVN